MLPNNKFKLFKDTDDRFRKLKNKTGITPNISARIAFFASVESGYRYALDDKAPDGPSLSNSIWFGDYEPLIETLIRDLYPSADDDALIKVWANHVKQGEGLLESLM